MKFPSIIFLIIFVASTLSCSKERNPILIQPYSFHNGDEIVLPQGYEVKVLPSDDSYFGQITNPADSTFRLLFDIGDLAGEYVDADSETKKKGKSVNEVFWYDFVDKTYINDPDCCLYITFPEAGPANFISLDDEYSDLVLDIMETFRSK